MKIRCDRGQVAWAPEDKPAQRSAWVRIHCDDGSFGIGEPAPIKGGLISLGIVKHNLAPALIGEDPLDQNGCSVGGAILANGAELPP